MNDQKIYTSDVLRNLDNCTGDYPEDILMDDQLTLAEFVDLWLNLFKKNSIKTASYSRLLESQKALSKYEIASKRLCEISFFDIQRYINSLVDAGYGMSGLKKQVLIVTAPLRQAAAMRVIKADPCVGIRLPTETKIQKKTKEVVAYSKEEQDRLIHNALFSGNVGCLATCFMIETGLRAGELLALKWSDIQLDRCRMKIHATIVNLMYKTAEYQDSAKSKSSNRILPLTPRAISILKKLKETRTTEWVFEQDGQRYTYQKLMYQTKKLCKLSRVKYYGEHVFRHTFATNCYYKGIDIKILSRMMGHSSVQVTYNIYVNLYGDGFDDMYAALCF